MTQTAEKKRKSPVYKITIEGMTEQIKSWPTKDVLDLKVIIGEELDNRKKAHEQALEELKGGK